MSKPTEMELQPGSEWADCGHKVIKAAKCSDEGCTYVFCAGDCGGASSECYFCDKRLCPGHRIFEGDHITCLRCLVYGQLLELVGNMAELQLDEVSERLSAAALRIERAA